MHSVIKCLAYTYLPNIKDICDMVSPKSQNELQKNFLKCLRQFFHFFIQFTKTGVGFTAKREM